MLCALKTGAWAFMEHSKSLDLVHTCQCLSQFLYLAQTNDRQLFAESEAILPRINFYLAQVNIKVFSAYIWDKYKHPYRGVSKSTGIYGVYISHQQSNKLRDIFNGRLRKSCQDIFKSWKAPIPLSEKILDAVMLPSGMMGPLNRRR